MLSIRNAGKCFILTTVVCLAEFGLSFVLLSATNAGTRQRRFHTTCLKALTNRQLQFWEDVDEGLDEIASFVGKDGQNIERIRQFCRSAKGEIPPPSWNTSSGHEPSEEHVYGLTAQPFWEPSEFPWASELEDNAITIIGEFESHLRKNCDDVFSSDSAWQDQVMGSGWSAIRLQRLGVWNTETCNQFSATYSLLQSLHIPLAVRGVCFARQAANSGVLPHSDGRNFILTAHLGLKIPEGCWIQVGREANRREWSEGKLTILDTSFSHSTGNPSDEDRHVLIIDFWHPELTVAEIAALEFIYRLRNEFESGQVAYREPRSLKRQEPRGLIGWWQSIAGKR